MNSSSVAAKDSAGSSAASFNTMSPHDPSLFSLLNSLFEPNFLILVVYLCINLYLAYRVIRVATRRYRQLKMVPREYGELGLVRLHAGDQSDVHEAHDDLFRIGSKPKAFETDTPVADSLIGVATWAFKDHAYHAKCIFMLLAVLSLASTWYYMLTFLRHSYSAYLERCHLASYPLPPTPPPIDLSRPALLVPALHLRVLRISQWLGSLSLFKEAWMEVIKDSTSWWWSSEICIITVGAWALFLRHEAQRLRIPHVWTVMALGQLVAISFAFNLFNLAVIYRLDVMDLLAARCDTVFKAKRRVIVPLETDSPDSPPEIWPHHENEREAGGYRVVMDLPPEDGPPAGVPLDDMPPTPRRSPDPDVRLFSTTLTVRKVPLPPQPTLMDRIARTMQYCIPEKVGLPLFVLAGLSSVLQHPNSFTKVMVMHMFPLLISLYPDYHKLPPLTPKRRPTRAFDTAATSDLSTSQILLKMLSRSQPRVPLWRDAKVYYLGLGGVSILLRLWLTLACLFEVKSNSSIVHRAWRTLTELFPSTFLRHPAQSSISSDHVCVAISASIYVLLESGVWLWKVAVASPSAKMPGDDADEDEDDGDGGMRHFPLPTSLRLDKADRKVVETQARAVVALLALSPLLGGSATFSLYLAVRCTWIQQYERYRGLQDDAILNPPERPGSNVIEDKEEIQLLENEEGERYFEVRKMKISEMLTRGQANRPRHLPHTPSPPITEEMEEPMTPPSSTPSDLRHAGTSEEGEIGGSQPTGGRARQPRATTVESETGAASSVEGSTSGRRTTPMRQRHPPQRYGELSPLTASQRHG